MYIPSINIDIPTAWLYQSGHHITELNQNKKINTIFLMLLSMNSSSNHVRIRFQHFYLVSK